MIKKLNLTTKERYELIDITEEVEKLIKESDIQDGLVIVFTPHSTAGIILTENEERLKRDWIKFFEKIISDFDFEHNKIDDNAEAHILSGLLGQQRNIVIEDGELLLGAWQRIFLAEFDGPRNRKIIIKIIPALIYAKVKPKRV